MRSVDRNRIHPAVSEPRRAELFEWLAAEGLSDPELYVALLSNARLLVLVWEPDPQQNDLLRLHAEFVLGPDQSVREAAEYQMALQALA